MSDKRPLTDEERQHAIVITEAVVSAINIAVDNYGITNTAPIIAGLSMVVGSTIMTLFPPELHVRTMETMCAMMVSSIRGAHRDTASTLN
jgi:hypothetical protein